MIYRVMNMRKKLSAAAKAAVILPAAAFCFIKTDAVKDAVREAVYRCLETVIPSLYAMLIVSGIIVRSGIHTKMPRPLRSFGRAVFGMEGGVFPIFLFSVFAGYPVGAKMLCTEAECGHLSKRRAELLSGVCFGAGPAFIFGCISGQLYGSSAAGRVILLCTVGTDILLALALRFFHDKKAKAETAPHFRFDGNMFTDCVSSAGRLMLEICFMIAAFAVLSAMLTYTGAAHKAGEVTAHLTGLAPEVSEQLIAAFLDVTSLSGLPKNDYSLLPFLCALTSFGGVCVLFQAAAAVSGKLSVKPLVIMRLAAAVISFFMCRAVMPFMLQNVTVSASSVSVHSERSPVPSVMLLLMTLMVLSSYSLVSASRTTESS